MKLAINDCLDISLATILMEGLDIADATDPKIGYRSPSGKTGFWNAEVKGSAVEYSVPANVFNETGKWYFWTRLVFPGDKAYSGTATVLEVVNPWENLLA
jgi:hypothetical protein